MTESNPDEIHVTNHFPYSLAVTVTAKQMEALPSDIGNAVFHCTNCDARWQGTSGLTCAMLPKDDYGDRYRPKKNNQCSNDSPDGPCLGCRATCRKCFDRFYANCVKCSFCGRDIPWAPEGQRVCDSYSCGMNHSMAVQFPQHTKDCALGWRCNGNCVKRESA